MPGKLRHDELVATLKENKAELIAALESSQPTKPTKGAFDAFVGNPSQAHASFSPVVADRPRLGSAARPMPVRGRKMPTTACLWATCPGSMTVYGRNRYLCSSCATWFELLELQGVYFGDLDAEFGDAAE